MSDILFHRENYVFSYRIAGILLRDNKILLQKPTDDTGYAVPGGHVEFGETNAQTLEREFKEEIGADITVGKLKWVAEIFFPWGDKPCHQICLYYDVALKDETQIPLVGVFTGDERIEGRNFKIEFHWKSVDNLGQSVVFASQKPAPSSPPDFFPVPDDDKPGKPITWFKTATAGFMVEKLQPLIDMLEKYSKPYDIVYTNFPGRIVYEDKWQIAVYSDNAPGRISPLSSCHLPLYAEVIRQSFATVAQDFNFTKENCPTFTGFIPNEKLDDEIQEGYTPFGYFVDGKLVGVVLLHDRSRGIHKMKHLAVLPEYRHFGYGQALLDYCKEKVVELGGSKITIGIIEENTVLKNWYAANGFTHTGIEKYEKLPFTVGYMEWSVTK